MARKKNGNGKPAPYKPTNPDIAFLVMKIDSNGEVAARGIADVRVEIGKTNQALEKVVLGLEKVTVGLSHVTSRLDQVTSRLDQVIVNTGGHWRDLDARVTALEQHNRAE